MANHLSERAILTFSCIESDSQNTIKVEVNSDIFVGDLSNIDEKESLENYANLIIKKFFERYEEYSDYNIAIELNHFFTVKARLQLKNNLFSVEDCCQIWKEEEEIQYKIKNVIRDVWEKGEWYVDLNGCSLFSGHKDSVLEA